LEDEVDHSGSQCTLSIPGQPDGRTRRIGRTGILLLTAVAVTAISAGFAMGPRDRGAAVGSAPPPGVTTDHSRAKPDSTPPSGGRKTASAPVKPSAKTGGKPTIAHRGPGTYVRADVASRPTGRRGRLLRYDMLVEKGLPFDADAAAREIQKTLDDRRSWRGSGDWRFELVASGRDADLHAYIATPKTTDLLCAPIETEGKVSCQNGTSVVLNAQRWAFGAQAFGTDLSGYRQYLVNHEFGHALGFNHVGCPGRGRPAPVMMQQTKGVQGCRPNPWPAPDRD